jgi:hypothetical protein
MTNDQASDVRAGDLPAWLAGFLAALPLGYNLRVNQENASYRDMPRPVFVSAEWLSQATAAERRAERLATVRQAHDTGVHGAGVRGCPWCADERSHAGLEMPCHRCNGPCRIDNEPSQLHHNRHYGVADRCRRTGVFPDVCGPGCGMGECTIRTIRPCGKPGCTCHIDASRNVAAREGIGGVPPCECHEPPGINGCPQHMTLSDPCASGCSDPAAHAEGGHGV